MTRRGVVATGICVLALAVVATGQLVRLGYSEITANDATYNYVGRSVLAGHLPTDVVGTFYPRRSPVFGTFLAAADKLRGEGDFGGAQPAACGLALVGLALAVIVGARLAGVAGAVGTTLVLLTTPVAWSTVPTMRVDAALSACVIGILLAFWRPTIPRALLAGALFGLAVLVKETSGLLFLLPLAWMGAVPRRTWLRNAFAYEGAAIVTAGWWWVMVWIKIHKIFPAEGIRDVQIRDVPRPFAVNAAGWLITIALAAGTMVFAWVMRHRAEGRLVAVAAIALLPPAVYAWFQELRLSQFMPIAVVAAIASGVVAGTWVQQQWQAGTGRRALAALLTGAVLVGACGTQWRTTVVEPSSHSDQVIDGLSEWLLNNTAPHDRVAMTYRWMAQVGLRTYGHTDMHLVQFDLHTEVPDLDQYVWVGASDGNLLGIGRDDLLHDLTHPPARYLVMTGPHRRAAPALLPTLRSGTPGLTPVMEVNIRGKYAVVFKIDQAMIVDGIENLRLHLSDVAALAWLDTAAVASSESEAVDQLLAAQPVVGITTPETRSELVERIGTDTFDQIEIGPSGH